MRKHRLGATLSCTILVGCTTGPGDIVAKMDSSTPKFHTAECEAARQRAIEFDSGQAGRDALTVGAGLVPIVGLVGIAAVEKLQSKDAQAIFDDLKNSCGEESLLPFMQEQADNGKANAQAWLGQAYAHGIDGLEKNPVQAVRWYGLAAKQGNTDAEINLGVYYSEGFGVQKDDARAAALWQLAADEGRPEAQTDLASFYLEGTGVAQNLQQARQLFHDAAVRGYGAAQLALADMYERGQGGERSDALAYEWYNIAARYRISGADAKRDAAAQRMGDNDTKLADRQIEKCLLSRYLDCP
jgi:TPR repeat protein